MSKKDKLIDMIENTDKSFEELVVESGYKASYVKKVFSELDLEWEDRDAEGVKLKTIIVKEEEDIEEIAEVEEQQPVSEELEDEQDDTPVVEEDNKEIDEEFIKEVEEKYVDACRRYRSIAARIFKTILDDLKSDDPGQYQERINRLRKMHIRTILQKRLFADAVKVADKYNKIVS